MSILGKIFKSEDGQLEDSVVDSDSVGVVKKAKAVSVVSKKTIEHAAVGKKRQDSEAYKVISNPLITEKATDLMALNKYVFAVPVSSNKAEVLKKIFNIYGVKPIKVNFLIRKGKKVRHGKTSGKTSTIKKAIITLDSKDKIEVYEGV